MKEKTLCESVFKQKELDKEYFTSVIAKMINSIERSSMSVDGNVFSRERSVLDESSDLLQAIRRRQI